MPEEYVKTLQDMYRSSRTEVVTQKGETEYFPIEVGLHQGSALSPLLFITFVLFYMHVYKQNKRPTINIY